MSLATKQCNRCHRNRTVSKFWRDARLPDGFRGICTTCSELTRGTGRRPDEVDPMAVERAVAGNPGKLNPAECREAVRILTERRLSYRDIAEHLRVASRTVTRARRHLHLTPPLCRSCASGACRWHIERTAA
ncbi:hypothetical protein B4N89_20790 [Embleya scabrispora]|uniref:Uncharacterized protein n=1 Tax=Embleya scabrispora TaxID=159449 RepID=A0A1T3P278_9ACTN|nr:hypothetical protein [Embleya scabrispora]OPC83051.1 hypothetical protein B4N89_20790 [Embleya scabrispora]